MSTSIVATSTPAALTSAADIPADRNPAAVYLGSLSKSGRLTMLSALNVIAAKMTGGRVTESRLIDWRGLRYQHVAAIRAKLQEDYAPATANKMLCALRGVAREAWRLGYINAEEYQRIARVGCVRGSSVAAGRSLTPAELDAMIETCASDDSPGGARDGALLVLLISGGLRRAEICGLTLSDYDRINRVLLVHGKGNKQREVPLNDDAVRALADWLTVRGNKAGVIFCPINKWGKVTIKNSITPQAIYDAVMRRAAQAGINNVTVHDFRRTFAGDLLDAGADISTVQKLLGHSNVTTTQRYDRRPERVKREAVNMLASRYTGRKNGNLTKH